MAENDKEELEKPQTDPEVLSEDEVDALLNDENTVQDDDSEPRVIDFTSQERVVRGQFPVLERIHERFAQKYIASIYNLMSKEIEIKIEDLKILKFSEYMSSLKTPSSINIIRILPLRGKALVVFDPELVYTLVENYFGGDGRFKMNLEEREFTISEQRIVDSVMELMFKDLQEAWSPIMKLDFETVAHEMNPQMVNVNAPTDILLISTFVAQFSETQKGTFALALPYSMLEPVREQLNISAAHSDDDIDPNWISALETQVMSVPLMLSSTLAQTTMTLREMSNIKVGDVIPLEIPETVTLYIEELPRFTAKYGISNDKCALTIIDNTTA